MPPVQGSAFDRAAATGAILGFGLSLGIASVAIPLLALAAGYDASTVGVLAAASAVTHLAARLSLPWLLERMSDRALICGAAALLATSYALLLVSTSLPIFVVAQLVSGGARAIFWTASQTHAIRREESSVRAIAIVNLLGSVGQVVGPALGGVLAGLSLSAALAAGLAGGVLAATAALGLLTLPTYDRKASPGDGRLWRRPGVDAACWGSFAGGGWRALLGSYVPVVLVGAGLPPAVIGALIALADGTAILTSGALVRFAHARVRTNLVVGVVTLGLGMALVPLAPSVPLAVALALAISGAGCGLVTTLGPALAADAVEPGERGAAIALTGTFRALALFTVPAGVAAAVVAIPLTVATAVASVAIILPTLAVNRLAARSRPTPNQSEG